MVSHKNWKPQLKIGAGDNFIGLMAVPALFLSTWAIPQKFCRCHMYMPPHTYGRRRLYGFSQLYRSPLLRCRNAAFACYCMCCSEGEDEIYRSRWSSNHRSVVVAQSVNASRPFVRSRFARPTWIESLLRYGAFFMQYRGRSDPL